MSRAAENKYHALAEQRTAAALRGREYERVSKAVHDGGDRLFRWRGTRSKWDRRYAARAFGWAVQAIGRHCG